MLNDGTSRELGHDLFTHSTNQLIKGHSFIHDIFFPNLLQHSPNCTPILVPCSFQRERVQGVVFVVKGVSVGQVEFEVS